MNSKNSKLVAVVIAIIILLGLGGYLLYGKSKAPQKVMQTTQAPVKSLTPATNTTLAGLMSLGQNLRCTFNTNSTTGASTNGTVYISKGNVRGDFTVKAKDGKQDQMSIIRVGDTNYIWGSALPTGIKMTLALDKLTSGAQTSQYSTVNQKTNYNCMPWSVDPSLFTPPASVKFTDMTGLMPVSPTGAQTQNQGSSTTTNPCTGITDAAAKTACENAMHSNGY
jgi:hypothetical protein